MTYRRGLLILVLLLITSLTAARAATLPSGFVETRLATGLDRPTAMTLAPDGRIFVCEEKGRLRVIKDGVLLAKPFVTLRVYAHGERGLLGVVVDPDFESNHYLYVYYTARKPYAHNRLSRFVADGDVARPGSETVLVELPKLVTELHNSGTLHFGPDGKLYVSVGENYIPENAQRLENPLGKILRFNPDGTIPADNPFYGRTAGLARAIWALGLRNPFSFTFERETGRMFINDVGHRTWEEINEGVAGSNYGWPEVEGVGNDPRFREPLFTYAHGNGPEKGCAITGGTFYDAPVPLFPPEYGGKYFFSDYCNGWIRLFDPETGEAQPFAGGIATPIGLTVGEDGSLFYLAHHGGEVFQVRYTLSQAPSIAVQPGDLKVAAGEAAAFSVQASGAAPLAYQWRRNGAPIPGATEAQHTLSPAGLADTGALFDVVVSNAFGSAASRQARLDVVNGHRPTASILAPANGTLYRAGDTISFRGAAADAEDGALPPAAMTWKIDFHHLGHIHPFLLDTPGIAEGAFTIPNQGEVSAEVWYRVYLSARDHDGLVAETHVDVVPRLATVRLETEPQGLKVTLDGMPHSAPYEEIGVVSMLRTIGAPASQTLDGDRYDFVSWSDGGAPSHTITTPETDAVWTATFRKAGAASNGLAGTYYAKPDFRGATFTRIDRVIDFDWKLGAPAPGIRADAWSARWTGEIEAQAGGLHTFFLRSDDGARLWIDGRLVVDDWQDHATQVSQGRIELEAGRRYSIRLEFHDTAGRANLRLLWSAPGLPRQVVPTERLFP